jgi:hypothetical protein
MRAAVNVRRINSMLWLATASCLAVGAVSLVAGVLLPFEVGASDRSVDVRLRPQSTRESTKAAALASFDQIASRKLRAPLADMPAASAPAGVSAAGVQQNRAGPVLVGTIGESLAMFRMPDGTIALKGVGDTLDGADVVSIHQEQVEMRSNGKRVTFTKPKNAEPSESGSIP